MNYENDNIITEMLIHYYNINENNIKKYTKQLKKIANKKCCAYILQKIMESSNIQEFFK